MHVRETGERHGAVRGPRAPADGGHGGKGTSTRRPRQCIDVTEQLVKEELSLSIARRGWHPSAQAWMLSCVRCFASGVMTVPKSLLLVPRATLP